MKKLFSLAMAFCLCAVANAQTETEKYYGAEKGDFSVSINAKPVVDFAGNLFNGTIDNELKVKNLTSAIAAKYFVTEKFAVTAALEVDNSKTKSFSYENAEDINFGKYETVTKEVSEVEKSWTFGVGAQYYLRPGKRLQPFVGAGLYFGKSVPTYTVTEQFAYTYDKAVEWDEDNNPTKFEAVKDYDFNEYTKSTNPTSEFTFVANLGVELFLSKCISVSTALDLGVSAETKRVKAEYENDHKDVKQQTIDDANYAYKSSKKTTFKTGMGNVVGGKLALNFYF